MEASERSMPARWMSLKGLPSTVAVTTASCGEKEPLPRRRSAAEAADRWRANARAMASNRAIATAVVVIIILLLLLILQ